jgi:hypothetical protein
MGINREWHLGNRMPKNATPEQRLRWHLEHQKNCACRKMPEKMLEKMKKAVKERPGRPKAVL